MQMNRLDRFQALVTAFNLETALSMPHNKYLFSVDLLHRSLFSYGQSPQGYLTELSLVQREKKIPYLKGIVPIMVQTLIRSYSFSLKESARFAEKLVERCSFSDSLQMVEQFYPEIIQERAVVDDLLSSLTNWLGTHRGDPLQDRVRELFRVLKKGKK
jgi:hypothetical protein